MWVLIFGGIAVAGLIMLVSYGIWLAHKASDVMSELHVLSERSGQFLELAAQIQVPDRGFDPSDRGFDIEPQERSASTQLDQLPAT